MPQETGDDGFAKSVAEIGDANGDGHTDYVIGAPMTNPGGVAHVYSGVDGSLLHTVWGESFQDLFGGAVAGAGDVNNDGYADFIVGARMSDAGGQDRGRAYVFSGLDASELYRFSGEADVDYFGKRVSGAGDVNNDGHDDVIVGTPNYGSPSRGCVHVFSGIDGALLHQFISTELLAYLGDAVGAAGDVDNDGFDDVIAGAHVFDGMDGRAFVYSGQTGAVLHALTSGAIDGQFGSAVSGAGDVDADGYDDVVVGAWQDETYGNSAGRAFVYSGLTGALLHDLAGPVQVLRLGVSASRVGDMDADGYEDVLVGAYRAAIVYSGLEVLSSKISGATCSAGSLDCLSPGLAYSIPTAGCGSLSPRIALTERMSMRALPVVVPRRAMSLRWHRRATGRSMCSMWWPRSIMSSGVVRRFRPMNRPVSTLARMSRPRQRASDAVTG